jgi:competence protein ComEC
MQDLSKRPLVCAAVAFAAGIAATSVVGVAAVWVLAAVGVAGLGVATLGRSRSAAGAVLLVAAAAVGGIVSSCGGSATASNVSGLPNGGQTLVGTVAEAPHRSHSVWRFVLEVEEHSGDGRLEPMSGRVYVRLTSNEAVQRGQRWRLTGKLRPPREAANPGQRSEASWLAPLKVSGVLTVGDEQLAELVGPGRLDPVSAHAFAAQQGALRLLERHVSGPYRELSAAVAASVVFGVHATPPPYEIREMFRRAGTIHLLVVSGAIVSMVFALVFLPGLLGATWRQIRVERQSGWPSGAQGRVRLRPGIWAAGVAVVVVIYYAILTEGGPAVARAAVMGVVTGIAIGLRRVPAVAREHGLNVDYYTLLAAAGLVLLAATPEALFYPGFQLSFAAVWAILYLTPKAIWLVGWLPKWIGYTIVGTIAAQLATFPILAYHYGQAPIAGFGANLLAIPLAAVVLVSGMATCALGVLLPWLAPFAGWICGHATRGMIWTSATFASLPGATVDIARPGALTIILWYAGLVALGVGIGRVHTKFERPPIA